MLTQLTTLKNRLGISEADTQYDAMLTNVIKAISSYFDHECRRSFARTADAVEEFPGDETELRVACYPIETVTRFELKSDEASGWTEVADARPLVRLQCVISLEKPLGTAREQGRVTFTGGYVLPGTAPGPGQATLPDDVQHAALEQAASWFQTREKLGLIKNWPSSGTFQQFSQLPLLPLVREVLRKYERLLI